MITGLNDPTAIAVSGSDLFVTCQGTGTVAEYTTGGVLVNATLVSGLITPAGIAASGGDLFITSTSTDTIGEYNATTGSAINTSLITGLDQPEGIAISGGDIFVANSGSVISTGLFTSVISGSIGEYTTSGAPSMPFS